MTAGEPRTNREDPEAGCSADHTAELVEEVVADTGLPVAETELDGYLSVVEAVQADGSTSFWLIDADAPASGRWRAIYAPHELTGPLPREFKQRVGLTCAATRTNGSPCRQSVKSQGALCHFHAEQGGEQ